MISYKSRGKLKLGVFLVIIALILWLIPTNFIFGDEEQDLEELQLAADEANEVLEAARAAADQASADLASAEAAVAEAEAELENSEGEDQAALEENLAQAEAALAEEYCS